MSFHEKVLSISLWPTWRTPSVLTRWSLTSRFHSHSVWGQSLARCRIGSDPEGRCNLRDELIEGDALPMQAARFRTRIAVARTGRGGHASLGHRGPRAPLVARPGAPALPTQGARMEITIRMRRSSFSFLLFNIIIIIAIVEMWITRRASPPPRARGPSYPSLVVNTAGSNAPCPRLAPCCPHDAISTFVGPRLFRARRRPGGAGNGS